MCRPSLATQDACHASHYRAFPPRLSFLWSRKDASGPHQPLAMHPRSPVPASPARSISCFLPEKWKREFCPIDRSERTFTAHAQRAKSRALRYRSVPLPPALLAILLTGAFEWFLNLLRLYLLRDNVGGRQGNAVSSTNVGSRTAPRALERPKSGGRLAPPLPGPYRGSAPARCLRCDSSRPVGCEPIKKQRLSGPDQSAFRLEGLTPI